VTPTKYLADLTLHEASKFRHGRLCSFVVVQRGRISSSGTINHGQVDGGVLPKLDKKRIVVICEVAHHEW
jgi:uncharacterized protein YifN (PemK superfamily)